MSYCVHVEPSGHRFSVEQDETVLDAALRQGFSLPHGCRNGACGACKGRLLSGEVHYAEGKLKVLEKDDDIEGQAFFCKALPSSDLTIEVHEADASKDIPVKAFPCRVVKLERLNHDVMYILLKPPATQRMQFLAGQYIDFLLKDGKRRSFSIANAPHEDKFIELHVRHVEDGRFTGEVFENMHAKDIVRIEGPLGGFYLREDSNRPMIFMAGGTGFAPVKGIIEHAIALGVTRPMHLYWGVRAREDIYQHTLAQGWADKYEHISYTPVLSAPKPGDQWQGKTGWVHEAVVADHADLSGYDVYASGPPVMVCTGRDAFAEQGLKLENYYSDAFEFND